MHELTANNPAVTAEALKAHIQQSFPHDLGIEPISIDDDRSVGRMRVDRRHLHPGGYVHGGAWIGLADSVAAWQTFRHLEAGHNFTSIEMKLNVFKAAKEGDELVGVAETLHAGRSTHVIEVRVTRDDDLVANLLVTQFVIPPPAEPRAGDEGAGE
jgi:uncharacterized protein (TIGR00369 family)